MADGINSADDWVSGASAQPGTITVCFVYDGLRIGHVPHPDRRSVILGVLGGEAADAGLYEEGFQARMTPIALRRAAAELLIIADACEGGRA